MTRQRALGLLEEYGRYAKSVKWRISNNINETQWKAFLEVQDVRKRFPDDGSTDKAMRWLGWVQGVMQACGVFTLEELKDHSRTGHLG